MDTRPREFLSPYAADPARLPHATWRLLNSGSADGATNMAIDEAILLAVANSKSPPTLRFYGWQPPCVSVGYAQPLRDEIDLAACQRKGYAWVRRPTGGRAVLHIDELTYSVIAPLGEPRVAGDILTSYRRLSAGLIAGLSLLGCKATLADLEVDGAQPAGRSARSCSPTGQSAACFDVPSPYEVMAGGRKLVGSAQARRRRVVLQHGALPLEGDVARLCDVLALPEVEHARLQAELRRRAVTLEEALGKRVSFEQAGQALATGFAQALNLTLQPGELSSDERVAMALLQEKHLRDEWLFDR